jgi:hypothetical protein
MTDDGNVFKLSKFATKHRPAEPVPAKVSKRMTDPWARVPLWWIERATELTHSPTTMVLIVLLYVNWQTKSATFPLPNARLKRAGISKKVKLRVLRDLERGGLIRVHWIPGKTPIVTLIGL